MMETEIRVLSGPVNLFVADPDIPTGRWIFIENTGTSQLRYRETAAIPALTDRGHNLDVGDGVVLLVFRSFWVWPPTGSGEITISDGAPMPTRGA